MRQRTSCTTTRRLRCTNGEGSLLCTRDRACRGLHYA
jgi:hypothetical protein